MNFHLKLIYYFYLDKLKLSPVLQMIRLPIVDILVCKKKLPFYLSIGKTQLCVGGIKGKDSCRGDSGGPLMTV